MIIYTYLYTQTVRLKMVYYFYNKGTKYLYLRLF